MAKFKQQHTLSLAPEVLMPTEIDPMLATLVDKPFDDPHWIFEVKWDGYRVLTFIQNKSYNLISRNQRSFNEEFPSIIKELKRLKVSEAILDGEVVILDAKGKSDFQLMQNFRSNQSGHLAYYVFDLLYLNGHDITSLPLLQRKLLLKELLAPLKSETIRFSDHVQEKGIDFFNVAIKHRFEGILAKDSRSPYVMRRSPYWQKIKTHSRQEMVIGGFTAPQGARKKFGALLVDVYENGELIYTGHVGGGFNQKSLNEVYNQLQPIVQNSSPFKKAPKPNTAVTWVSTKLVCEVAFSEWTKEGIMRQPIFKGMRIDKSAEEVKREKPLESHP